MTQQNDNPASQPSEQPKSSKKRRGLWWKIPLVLVLLLVLFVILLPTIASTSPVRGIILGQVNGSIPGKVAVNDWSLGWFSSVNVSGIEYADKQGNRQATVGKVQTNKSLLQLIRGDYRAVEVLISDVSLEGLKVDLVGKPVAPTAKTITLPDFSGNVKIENVSGQVTLIGKEGKSASVRIGKETGSVIAIPQAGPADVKATVSLEQAGKILVSAQLPGVKSGAVIDPNTLQATAKLLIQNLDLAQAGAVAKVSGVALDVTGQLNGQIDASTSVAGPGTIAVKGELTGSDIAISGALLKGDRIVTKQLRMPMDLLIATQGPGGQVKVNALSIVTDQASIDAVVDMPLASIQEFLNGTAISKEGIAHLKVKVADIPAIMNSLRNTVRMQEGVQLTAGQLDLGVEIKLAGKGVQVSVPMSVNGLSATRDGQKIGPLAPLTVAASARVAMLPSKQVEVRDLDVSVISSFVTLTAKGATLATASVHGECDLLKLKADLGQIIDLSSIIGGKAVINVVSRTGQNGDLEPDAQVTVSNLTMDLPAGAQGKAYRVENGSLLLAARGAYQNGILSLSQPARLEVAGRLLERDGKQPARLMVDQAVQVLVSGSANVSATPATVHVAGFSATLAKDDKSPAVQISLSEGAACDLTLAGKAGVAGNVKLMLRGDIGQLLAAAQQATGTRPAAMVQSGILRANMSADIASDGAIAFALTDSTTEVVIGATGKESISEKITARMDAKVVPDRSKAHVSANLAGSCFMLDVAPTTVGLPTGKAAVSPLQMLSDASIKLTVSDLARASKLAGTLSGKPMAMLSGAPVTVTVLTTRKDAAKGFTLSMNVDANSGALAMTAATPGAKAVPIKPISIKTHASIDVDPTQADLVKQIQQIRVDALDAQTELGTISLPTPIVVSDIPAIMAAMSGGALPQNAQLSGEVAIAGDLGRIWSMVSTDATAKYSLAGQFLVRPKLSLNQGMIVADISSQIADFRVLEGQKVVVQESKLGVHIFGQLSPAAHSAKLAQCAITSADGLMTLNASGEVADLGKANRVENAKVEITPDLARIWPIVYAMLTPIQQQKIGQLDLAGKDTNIINVSGSFPADKPYADAVKQLTASGTITLASADWKTRGIVLKGLIRSFVLKAGVVQTPADPKCKPAVCNGGTIDLADLTVDVTGDSPRLSIPAGKVVARGIQLNTVLMSSLGKYANPLFVDPQKVAGAVDVSVVRCERLPLGMLMFSPEAANDGYAEFSITVTNIDMASKGTDILFKALAFQPQPGADRVVGNITDARVIIAKGKCTQKADLHLGTNAIGFNGQMNLADNYYDFLKAELPSALLSSWFRSKDLLQYVPARVPVSFKGPATALKLDPSSIKDLVSLAAQTQVQQRLLGGAKIPGLTPGAPAGGAANPATQPANAVDTLIDLFGKKKKK